MERLRKLRKERRLERLQFLKAQLALYAKLYTIWDSPTSPGNSYAETVAGLDAKNDLHKCIVAKVSEYGMPQGPPELPQALPCSSNDFDNENWKTPKAPDLPQFDVKHQKDVKIKPAGPPPSSNSTSSSSPSPSSSSPILSSAPSSTIPTSSPTLTSSNSTTAPNGGTGSSTSTSSQDEETTTSGGETKTTESSAETEPASPSKDGGEPSSTEPEGPIQYAKAIYDYSTDHTDDLQFHVGDIIRLITPNVDFSTHDPNNPIWLLGELRDNPDKTGSFPSNYVEDFKP